MTANLPDVLPSDFVKSLMNGIADSRAGSTTGYSGKPLLRLMKSGEWVFGQENIEVQEGSRWCVNVMSLEHGWTCWVDNGSKNKLAGEVMAPVNVPRPPKPAPIDGTEFKEQRNMELKCLDGEDAGTEVLYKASSYGGLKASVKLMDEVYRQLARDPHHPCPVLELRSDTYPHSKWGQVVEPILVVVGWADMHGRLAGAPEIAAQPPAPAPAPSPAAEVAAVVRRRRAEIAQSVQSAPAAVKPVEETAAKAMQELAAKAAVAAAAAVPLHTGQRRRPVTR
jgi:hypothetical protein